jgi:cytochrome c
MLGRQRRHQKAFVLAGAAGEAHRATGPIASIRSARTLVVAAVSATTLTLSGCGPSGGQTAQSPAPEPSATDKVLLAELPAPYSTADLDNGRLHFNLCRACHTIIKGAPNLTGPNLYGVFGRKVASVPDYGYSAALKAKGWVWDAQHLNGWLKDPQAYVPGTKMGFYGLHDDKDRIDTIAYLKVASSGGGL